MRLNYSSPRGGASDTLAQSCKVDLAFKQAQMKFNEAALEEIMRTNDMVLISVVESILKQAEIGYMVADQNMSVLEGSIGLLPRRILVQSEKKAQAIALLRDAELGHELRD